jgi:hypothetical protein
MNLRNPHGVFRFNYPPCMLDLKTKEIWRIQRVLFQKQTAYFMQNLYPAAGIVALTEKSSTAKILPLLPLVFTSRETVCDKALLTMIEPVMSIQSFLFALLAVKVWTFAPSNFKLNDRELLVVIPSRIGLTYADTVTAVPAGRSLILACMSLRVDVLLLDAEPRKTRPLERLLSFCIE